MTDAAELARLKERIDQLAGMAADEHAAAARTLADELKGELAARSSGDKPASGTSQADHSGELRAPRETNLRCPRCTLHSFNFQPGSMRTRDDGAGYEARFHCMSCGFEDYAPFKPR
ncbi:MULTISPECIES: hypothetical protein [unclassified Thioalkalivibrio]|uniref:hypothetical protein n=1 Tax=unclassified Thioalkalivibrio TaxID=2621013 RepID=UPI00035FF301|nr:MULTISPECIES: hypothetical protein [unclassified Thioalkalivibrio]